MRFHRTKEVRAVKITKSGSPQWERQVLLGLISDQTFLSRVAPLWKEDSLTSKYACMLGQLCVDHFRRYNKPPNCTIVQIITERLEDFKDDDAAKQLDRLLQSLDDVDLPPTEYLMDLAGKHLNRVGLSRLADGVQEALSCGNISLAESLVTSYRRVELGRGAGVDLFTDEAAVRGAFLIEEEEDLFSFPGDLGDFFGCKQILSRDSFLAFLAPMKTGKCVSEDTEVLLSNGELRTIRDIVEGMVKVKVVSLDEDKLRMREAVVSQLWDNGEKECWELTTRTGRRVVTTKNHQYLTPDGWKVLEDVREGDFVAVPKKLDFFGTEPLPEEELRFLAYMIADGCCVQGKGKSSSSTSCTFTKTNEVLVQDFLRACDRLGVKHLKRGITYLLSGTARGILRKYGVLGHSSRTKEVPAEIFRCPKEQVAVFLNVFMSCDGYTTAKGGVEVTLANEKLVHQLSHLLTRFGVVSRVFYKKARCGEKVFDSWRLSILDEENSKIFFEEINMMSYKGRSPESMRGTGRSFLDKFPPSVAKKFLDDVHKEYAHKGGLLRVFGEKRKWAVGKSIRDGKPVMRKSFLPCEGSRSYKKHMESHVLWDEVVLIKSVGKRKTYDLGVDKFHNFVANNCIVHNTYTLIDIAWRAMLNRRKVAFFQVGDLSERQLYSRFLVKASRRPLRATSWPARVRWPISITTPPRGELCASVEFKEKVYDSPLNPDLAWEACKKVMRDKVRSERSYFRCSVHPNFSISAQGIRSVLLEWVRDDFIPDVVVIDYADLLTPSPGTQKHDKRDQVDTTWKQLRALSTEFHCLLVTATQANRESFDRTLMKRSCVGEDVRKLAHASGVVGINVTAQDKERQLSRLQWLVLREGEFFMDRVVHVAGCLALSAPAVLSTY